MNIKPLTLAIATGLVASTAAADVWTWDTEGYGYAYSYDYSSGTDDLDFDQVGPNTQFDGLVSIGGGSTSYFGDCDLLCATADTGGGATYNYGYAYEAYVHVASDTTLTIWLDAGDDNQFGTGDAYAYVYDLDTGTFLYLDSVQDGSASTDVVISPNVLGYELFVQAFAETPSDAGWATASAYITPTPGTAALLGLGGLMAARRRR